VTTSCRSAHGSVSLVLNWVGRSAQIRVGTNPMRRAPGSVVIHLGNSGSFYQWRPSALLQGGGSGEGLSVAASFQRERQRHGMAGGEESFLAGRCPPRGRSMISRVSGRGLTQLGHQGGHVPGWPGCEERQRLAWHRGAQAWPLNQGASRWTVNASTHSN